MTFTFTLIGFAAFAFAGYAMGWTNGYLSGLNWAVNQLAAVKKTTTKDLYPPRD